MSDPVATRTVTLANRLGLHVRAAREIVLTARRFDAQVFLGKDLHRVAATDILEILSLGAAQGEQLSLEATGREAEAAAAAIEALFQRKFDED
jgi:phosphocarrier protein NPr